MRGLHESRSYKALSLVTTMTVGSPGSGQQKHSTCNGLEHGAYTGLPDQ